MTLCKHGTEKDKCLDCFKQSICPHNVKVRKCLICMCNVNCNHKKRRGDCAYCCPIYCSICDVISDKFHIASTPHIKMKLNKLSIYR